MTVKQMVELVTQSFPAFGRTQILFELNIAQREFCFATDVLMSVATLTREDDAISITTENVETWQMPLDTYRIIQIDELYLEEYELQDDKLVFSDVIMLNGNGITVQEYDPNDNNDQRTVSTFVVVSAEENPNFEYFATGT
jgi:hypothetical protein